MFHDGLKAMFERKHQKLVPTHVFIRRMVGYFVFVIVLIGAALLIGVLGYHFFDSLSWVDALLEASMILGGMGEINPLTNSAAKVFASMYALFSGLLFIAIMGILFTPILHRLMHSFHMEDKDF